MQDKIIKKKRSREALVYLSLFLSKSKKKTNSVKFLKGCNSLGIAQNEIWPRTFFLGNYISHKKDFHQFPSIFNHFRVNEQFWILKNLLFRKKGCNALGMNQNNFLVITFFIATLPLTKKVPTNVSLAPIYFEKISIFHQVVKKKGL